MSGWHRFFRILVLAALTLTGLGLVQASMSDRHWHYFLAHAQNERTLALGAGTGLLILAFFFMVSGIKRRRGRFLSFANEGGRVNISTTAIADYLSKLASEFPSFIRMDVRIVPLRGTMDAVINVRVKADPQIHEICETLQGRVRESLAGGLGIHDVRRVEVNVNEINSERRGAS